MYSRINPEGVWYESRRCAVVVARRHARRAWLVATHVRGFMRQRNSRDAESSVLRGAIMAASSQGGLFECGTDDAVVANLTPLARPGVPIVACSK